MKKSIVLCTLFIFSIGKSFAQSDFRDGYIIDNNNDTTYGLIDYKGNAANAKECTFKKDPDAEKIKYAPEDIKAYRFIDSKYYVSKNIDPDRGKNLVFLEYLINGIVDVYYYRGDDKEHYLIDKGDGRLAELKNEEKEYDINGTRYVKKSKEYIGVLKYIFHESPTVVSDVESTQLNHKSLIKITNEYHHEVCKDEECIIYEKKLPKMKIKFGPAIGLNVMTLSTKNISDEYTSLSGDENSYYYLKSSFDQDFYPSFGLFLNLNAPNLNERLSIQYENSLSKWSLKTHNIHIEPIPPNNEIIDTNDISITQHVLYNSLLLRYEFPKRKFQPVLEAGFFLDYFFKTDYFRQLESEQSWGDDRHTSDNSFENPFMKSDYGLNLGIGCIIQISKSRDINIDFKYQRGSKMLSERGGLLSRYGVIKGFYTNHYSLNIGIPFGK